MNCVKTDSPLTMTFVPSAAPPAQLAKLVAKKRRTVVKSGAPRRSVRMRGPPRRLADEEEPAPPIIKRRSTLGADAATLLTLERLELERQELDRLLLQQVQA